MGVILGPRLVRYVASIAWASIALIAYGTTNSYELFRGQLDNVVGKPISGLPPSRNWGDTRDLINVTQLSNGNAEYRFRYTGGCRYVLEVEKQTTLILRWRLEGDTRDCYINP